MSCLKKRITLYFKNINLLSMLYFKLSISPLQKYTSVKTLNKEEHILSMLQIITIKKNLKN